MNRARFGCAALLALVLLPARAGEAATVSREPTGSGITSPLSIQGLIVTAAPGETNDVRIEYSEARTGWVVRDSGAPITVGAGCVAEGADAFCARTPDEHPDGARIDLNDGNDSLLTVGRLGHVAIKDGDGDDDIKLTSDDAFGMLFAGPGADRYDSANSQLWLRYGPDRDHGVAVSVDGVANDGAAGEGDNVIGSYSTIEGTTYADELRAGTEGVRLEGYSGDDTIVGGPGNDTILARGRHLELYGQGGDDFFDLARTTMEGTISGGDGRDTVLLEGNGIHGFGSTPVSVTLDGVANDGPDGGRANYLPDIEVVHGAGGSPEPGPTPGPSGGPVFGAITPKSATTRATAGRKYFALTIRCAAGSPAPCTGQATVRPRKGLRTVYAQGSFGGIPPGTANRVMFRVVPRWRETLKRGRSIAGRVVIDTTAAGSYDVKRVDPAGLVRIKPARR